MHHQMILWFLLVFIGGLSAAADSINHISINGGGAAAAAELGGRQWLAAKGSSTMKGDLITAVDPARYETARISRSQFSYSFRLNPGQKSIRLHFNPSSYDQFESLNDLFAVEAGPYSLLANFSASIIARALAVDVIVREFCIITKEDETLDLVFSPENKNYAFINGIEIISAPSTTVSYCHGGDIGAHVIGQKPLINVDNTTALERVHYRHIKWGSASSDDDIGSMFGMWGKKNTKMANNKTWRVSVDVGFKYLVRLHLCDVGLEMDFVLLIDNIIILTSSELRQQREKEQNMLWYNNYMVMVEAGEEEEKRDISISLHSRHEFLDRHGPLEGFEVFKLSNHDRGLASPSPLLKRGDSQQALLSPLQALLYNLHLYIKPLDYTTLYAIFLTTCIIVTVINLEQNMSVDYITKEVDKPSARVKQYLAIENFHDGLVLRRGESGKAYKGHIDNGREFVMLSNRSNPGSSQWEHRFWTEVEMFSSRFWIVVAMLSELLRVNLVFFIEECRFIFGYMLYRIFGEYLYRLARESDDFCHLSWKQDHDICIGADLVLDYLHMRHGISFIDLKASTMLLDKNIKPKLSDFGLAEIGRGSLTLSQHIKKFEGSSEYLDAIFFGTSKQTEENYSFGALVLEILCGRPAPPWNEQDKGSLITWAIKYISEGQVDHIVAPSLRGVISPNSLKSFLKISSGPLLHETKKRPETAQILTKLEHALPQQEKAESVAMNGRNGIASLISSMMTSWEKNMDLFVPTAPLYDEPGSRNCFVAKFSDFGLAIKRLTELRHINLELVAKVSVLKAAIRNFRRDSVLGEGGFGKVYKGWIDDKASGQKTIIAVKTLNSESFQGFVEWKSEVNFLGRLSHPNLVKLLGHCWEDKELLLVYEFMAKGSLENHLFGRGTRVQPLPRDIRLKILLGVARGLAFLHASIRKVVYRDFKAANILLDGSYNDKLSDFGLAKMGPTVGHSHVTTQVMGTYGYAAPEYVATGYWYVKMGPTASGPLITTPVVEIYHTINSNATGKYDQTLIGSENEINRSNKACGCTECYCWALIIC